MTRRTLSAGLLIAVACGCSGDAAPELSVTMRAVESPAGAGSGEPFLSATDGAVHMSWLEASPTGGHDLRFSRWDSGAWTEAGVIATSERFFVNWADFPSVTAGADGSLWAHWLERGPAGGYDYAVRVVRSADGGRKWSEPWTLHDDSSPVEHGFVSALPLGGGMAFLWLDGRNTGSEAPVPPADRAMTLRHRFVGADGTPGPETLVDARVCDCCQTDAALTAAGPVAVYRDRTREEIRDIYVTRLVNGAWTEGVAVHADGWEIGGCPVNGPAVAADGDDVAVAWFTAPGDVPRVKVAFSSDAGAHFGAPLEVDGGNPAGRVDVLMLGEGVALVSWLERTGGEDAEIRLRRVDSAGGMSESVTLDASSAERASGFPRMIRSSEGSVLMAWTDVTGDRPHVRVARLDLEGS